MRAFDLALRPASISIAVALLLAACGERNTYQPPPPAEVSVAKPEQRKVTLYMEVTGSTAPFNHVDLVARVQGFLDKVGYKDGAAVKKGDLLFRRQAGLRDRFADRASDAGAARGPVVAGRRRPEAQAGSREDGGGVGRPAR